MKLWAIIIIFFSITAQAEIYKSVDANGVVTYSDQPTTTSQSVQLPAVNIVTKPVQITNSTNATNAVVATTTTKHVDYTSFTISSPKDQDSFYNADSLSVTADITPALQEGDKIEFLLDGNPVTAATASTTATIPKVDGDKPPILVRGTHTISANVLDASGKILSTTPAITIYLQYTSINQPSYPK